MVPYYPIDSTLWAISLPSSVPQQPHRHTIFSAATPRTRHFPSPSLSHQQIPAVGFEVETALNLKTWWLVSLAVSLILGWERYLQGPAIATWPKPGGLGCQAIQLGFEVEDSMNEVERLNGRSGFVRARSQGSLAMVRCNEMCILSSVTVYHTGQIY